MEEMERRFEPASEQRASHAPHVRADARPSVGDVLLPGAGQPGAGQPGAGQPGANQPGGHRSGSHPRSGSRPGERSLGADRAGAPPSGAAREPDRPQSVPGPHGPLTLDMLPPPNTSRWVVRRKAEVLAAIKGGLLTAAEACARYRLSPEELELWQESLDRAGVPGLRVTRIQLYRDFHPRPRSARPNDRGTERETDRGHGWSC
jgi:hypothetical protein